MNTMIIPTKNAKIVLSLYVKSLALIFNLMMTNKVSAMINPTSGKIQAQIMATMNCMTTLQVG
jgi:hypothetical protein